MLDLKNETKPQRKFLNSALKKAQYAAESLKYPNIELRKTGNEQPKRSKSAAQLSVGRVSTEDI